MPDAPRLAAALLSVAMSAALFVACDDDSPLQSSELPPDGDLSEQDQGELPPGPSSECGSVRMTQYAASEQRWCGFDRSNALLPAFVREGLTVAIAEPWNGSSYGGEAGEACGECWELDTLGSEPVVVMVHDLCPIEGNPSCAGSHFHFDVSNETAAALGDEWLGEAAVRRVPCPVSGNIHARISDRNQWGYLKLAFFNHRFPIRQVEYQPVGSTQWQPMERCLARWCEAEDMQTFAANGPGARFRFSSAAGEVVEGSAILGSELGDEAIFDTGIQFGAVEPPSGVCLFSPPPPYDEEWGGIEGVRWTSSSWGSFSLSEPTEDCYEDSASCLLLDDFSPDSGLHITYRSPFPVDLYQRLTLQARLASGTATVRIAPRTEDGRCAGARDVELSEDWTLVEFELSTTCAGATVLTGLTLSHPSSTIALYLDELFFE
ncbi:MAG: hypothetical protein RBU37_10865 [Myxococcota bacterium]|jgi:hypothetical protein|nr:hypothetical protein [Myxococcota bacterium]